ncbi:MAG: glycosyltransferase [Sulfuritalea sp.]|nr:glycosyltransferase [Sulfuritalea sp.]
MRVLNVVSVLSGREGGGNAERTVQLSRVLAESGTACTVLTLDIGDLRARLGQLCGIRLVVAPCLNARFQIPWPAWRLVRELVQQADVIHLMGYWSLLGVMVQAAARKAGVPYVICPAGALPLFGRSRWAKRIYNIVVGQNLIARARGWIAVTKAELPHFEAYGIPRSRVTVISNGVWESDFATSDGEVFFSTTGIPDGPFVLFMGRLNPIKGPDLLLEAFGRLADAFPDYRLVFAGPDEGMQAGLQARIRVLGLTDRVFFCGFVSGGLKVAAYRAACLLVVPSRSEAMSIVVVEGGICGTPVLMTDQCGLDDLAEINPGLIVPASIDGLTAGLRLALESPGRLADWGEKWRSMVRQRFLWRDIAQQFKALLEEVAQQKEA